MIKIIGAGLAGTEAAYFLANNNIRVKLYEMRPHKMTPAHQTSNFAELVCSNSLRSNDPHNAVGLLKEEMREFNSLIMEAAKYAEIKAGSSLAVDRELFSNYIENKIRNHPLIEIVNEEVKDINLDELTVIAAGPLASDLLVNNIIEKLEIKDLHFFDAIAPIIKKDSIDMNICYLKSRYDKGEASYINCPMNKAQYEKFYNALVNATKAELKAFEKDVFDACMPVEVIASKGIDTLLYGPLKPVGLEQNGKRYHAVVQLRQDDVKSTMYNIVGFQTNMTYKAQKEVISLIPGLEKAEIFRYGVMHRNTYIESPKILNNAFQVKAYPKLFFAGQISGVEGYVESAASGLNVAIQITNLINNGVIKPLPEETMIGALANYIASYNSNFVPMNANLGLLPELDKRYNKKLRKEKYYERAISNLKIFKEEFYESLK